MSETILEVRRLTKKKNSGSLCTVIPSTCMRVADLKIGDLVSHEQVKDHIIIRKAEKGFLRISTDRKITVPFRIARNLFNNRDNIGFYNDDQGNLCYTKVTKATI
ncbi:TPA_asm: hypothetical protein vir519_00058 [Caudoviricetes sp. vir519]|nr:TPA_asm: hypothetical protein vir519_00058 [Caudoviricetes sp. vir519]